MHHQNQQEVKAITLIAEHLEKKKRISYKIVTPYEAQRSAIEGALKVKGLDWHDKCFNVDSFQGSFAQSSRLPELLTHLTRENRQRRPRHRHFRSPHKRSWIHNQPTTNKRDAYSMPTRHVHCLEQGVPPRKRCHLTGRNDGGRAGKTARRLAHSEGY
jgi:hypothetical protein